MIKLVLIGMMCLMSAVTFGKTLNPSNFQCTAHFYLHVFSGGTERIVYSEVTASTCSAAMSAAREVAEEIAESM